jgi:hypothetical protein
MHARGIGRLAESPRIEAIESKNFLDPAARWAGRVSAVIDLVKQISLTKSKNAGKHAPVHCVLATHETIVSK